MLPGVQNTLKDLIPAQKAALMYKAYDIIGDIIIAKIPDKLAGYEQEVGVALHASHPTVKRVFRVIGHTEKISRNRQLRLIYPTPSQKNAELKAPDQSLGRTVHSEHGCRFVVDVEKVFFTPRLSYERMRIARQVKPEEVVANLFGGVGTYAIIIAKVCPGVNRIYTVDVNPFAHGLAEENIALNRLHEKIIPILGDARTVCPEQLRGLCNRVIMPLPEEAALFLDSAITALKRGSGSTINFYAVVSGRDVRNEAARTIDQTRSRALIYGAKSCDALTWRIVREVGPRKYHVAIDLKITK